MRSNPPLSALDEDTFYGLKEISFKGIKKFICIQHENANALLLKGDINLDQNSSIVSFQHLLNVIVNHIIERYNRVEKSDSVKKNHWTQVETAMQTLKNSQTGLCVNIQFKDVNCFEFTPEIELFDLCGLTLYHGWIPDPESPYRDLVLSKVSYNSLAESLVSGSEQEPTSIDPNSNPLGYTQQLRLWLNDTVSQLTFEGIHLLTNTLSTGEVGVFFRNNHFSVITKQNQKLYLLITDQGFQNYKDIVWEELDTIYGGSNFYNSNFELFTNRIAAPSGESDTQSGAHTLCNQQKRRKQPCAIL